ncbi:MAG: ankyrin repeat domain-containing protein [Alphaproteobacteria bacterium]
MQNSISNVFNALGITAEQLEKALLTEVDRFSPDNGVVKDLLYCASDLKVSQECLNKALFAAVEHDKGDIAWLLLEHGADIETRNAFGDTPLLAACRENLFEMAKMLVYRGAEINVRDIQGQTPLMAAARLGNLGFAQDLIAKGAILDIPSSTGATAYSLAEQHGRTEIAALLKPKSPSPEEFGAALVNEVYNTGANVDSVRTILNSQPNLKPHQQALDKALFGAVANGKTAIAELLLGSGANIEARNHFGSTPLLAATRENFVATASMLISKGADIDALDINGQTPLMMAAYCRSIGVVRALLARGANAVIQAPFGATALSAAERSGNAELIGVIKSVLPKPDAAPKKQKVPKKKHRGHKHR